MSWDGSQAMLTVDGLTVSAGSRTLLQDVSFSLMAGATMSIVGRSGSGKTVLAKTILGMNPPDVQLVSGSIGYKGADLLTMTPASRSALRGRAIAPIFTSPRSQLDPLTSVGAQIMDVIRATGDVSRTAAHDRAIELITDVGIPDPSRRMHAFPHELSGGMCQRIVIALALANNPSLIIADEPTAGLDVTIQLQALELLEDLVSKAGAAVLLLTRDLAIAANFSSTIGVLDDGQLVEQGATETFFRGPTHPHSQLLLDAARDATLVGASLP